LSTADLLDAYPDAGICLLQFRSFGARAFSGSIATVRCFEDNVVLKATVSKPGDGRVLVVDGGGSMRYALLGDNIATIARDNGWAGVVLNACVRDSVALDELGFGVKALGTNPRPSPKGGEGEVDVPVTFGEVTFEPGAQLYADEDGVIVLPGV
jgi:regulator of ribonuclease activity A